ncbi:CopD family protein [Thermaerobacter composti]|uniref:CopD family protein n=1 Tax=Thermaerobacter composti TaxID=554949 RepID=A0ABZ0QLA0_9FIRM|nr:CopD family protein [Thermaerobacter composti]PZN06282.1 MAG: copper resistance protein CopD [Bacillota bacterium]WPD18271.1 CopD family protein [Thermaerobacter composti]
MRGYELVVFVHVLAAMVWVGGILFLSLVVVPASRRYPADVRARLFADVGRRFRVVGWTALAILAVTGAVQMAARGATLANVMDGSFFQTPWGRILGAKLLAVSLMMLLTAMHDFVAGPAAERAARAGGDPERLRRRAGRLARVTAILALIVVFLAVQLVR